MKCQSYSLGKKKENIISLSSAEFAHRVIKVKGLYPLGRFPTISAKREELL